MKTLGLDGTWMLTYGPERAGGPDSPDALARTGWPTVEAQVPGNVEIDLQRAGVLPEPLELGTNIYELRKYETHEWWYAREFDAAEFAAGLGEGSRVEIVFDGLDCIATVWLNDQVIGRAANMLVPHRFDVTEALRPGGNRLAVRIASAVLAGRRRLPDAGEHAFAMGWESLAVRKAPHMYGWDIMPRAVGAGLWRGVRLEEIPAARSRSVYWATRRADPRARRATAVVDWDFATGEAGLARTDAMLVRASLARNGREVAHARAPALGTHGKLSLEVEKAELWWPRGYGEPALHDARVELVGAGGETLARHECRIGLRTIELRRTEVTTDDQPGEFVFVVNGEKVFAKGTNWVPLDAFHSRDLARVDETFAMVADLGCNMVRCWGGNVYESDRFFDLCDESGVMVWQDFSFACAVYPQDDSFLERVRIEAEAVVRRLRNRASLALWAGNNECDEVHCWTGSGLDPNDDRVSRGALREVVRVHDPSRAYLPSSPYFGPELVRRGLDVNEAPERHLWGPRDDFKGTFYTSSRAHFASEIGYHGCPGRASLERMMESSHLWPAEGDEQWLAHAVRPHPDFHAYDYRIPLMRKQVEVLFGRSPDALDDFVLASQASQAEALKFFIERFRAAKWRRTGILWWNVRDGWPQVSDAVVDYYGARKLAYEYVRRVQEPVCAIVTEPEGGRHALVVANDTRAAARGGLSVRDAGSGSALHQGAFEVDPNGIVRVGEVPQAHTPAMWLLEWRIDGRESPFRSHYLAGPRPFALGDYARWMTRMGLPRDLEAVARAFALAEGGGAGA